MRSQTTKVLCFDLDGTLLDSFPSHFEAYKRVFRKIGRNLSKEQFLNAYSPNWHQMYIGLEVPLDYWESLDESWRREIRKMPSVAFAGVKKALERLGRHFMLAVVSAGSRERVISDLARNGIGSYFAEVITGSDIQLRKPNPEGLIRAIHNLGVNNDQAIYIGDAEDDYQMAVSAGVDFIGIRSDFKNLKSEVTILIDHIEELVELPLDPRNRIGASSHQPQARIKD
ncbi:MAG TPA: HAD family hydrolase [Bacteroidota bacterium]